MPLSSGAKVHVVERRLFEGDVRRHFVGEVEAVAHGVARVRGFAFVYEPGRGGYVRSTSEQNRLIALTDAQLIIRVLPPGTRVGEVQYHAETNRTIVSDGTFELEIADFGPRR